jgi:uncharacterized protein (DUF849 family)
VAAWTEGCTTSAAVYPDGTFVVCEPADLLKGRIFRQHPRTRTILEAVDKVASVAQSSGMVLLKAALNGDRPSGSHPSLPLSPQQLVADASLCVHAGAGAIHMHPRDSEGHESFDVAVIDAAVRHVRTAVSVPIGVSTGAWILPGPEERAEAVSSWREPDMASVNLSEDGAELVMEALDSAGIGIEVGVWSVADVERLAASRFTGRLLRVLVEIVLPSDDPAAEARAIDAALDRSGITTSRFHHGEGDSAWPVLRQAIQLGRDIRVGLEDTLLLPDGALAVSNESLVRAASEIGERGQKVSEAQ